MAKGRNDTSRLAKSETFAGKPAAKATIVIDGDTLYFAKAGEYTIEYLPSGNVKIKLDGGHSVVLKPDEWAGITSFEFAEGATLASPISIDGVTFHEADATGPFEISHDLDSLLGHLISTYGIVYTLENVTINGSTGDTFKVLWDYLDDAYVAGGNPFNVELNETFVRLGVEYVEYIEGGGEPLTFVTAKFAADNADADDIPQREQSMHDNFLGNLTIGAINGRFSGDPVLKQELLDLIPDEYESRLLYEGNNSQVGGPRHDDVRAFDYDKGWDRPDYYDADLDGVVDPLARDGNEMYYGDGNTIGDWNILRHEGAQVELALKIKHRQGSEYDESFIDADGVAHYVVESGPQPGVPNRAEWSFDFSATDYSPDEDFTYKIEIDIDPGEDVEWLAVYSSDMPFDTETGLAGELFQNSSNYAFFSSLIDTDPDAAGIQPYAFGEGEFDIRMSVFDSGGTSLIAQHEVVVHVEPPVI